VIAAEFLRRVRRLHLRARRAVAGPLGGAYRSAFKGAGIEFADVRPYEPGDDVRRLDASTTARTGRPHIRRHVEERELTVVLLLDRSASLDFGSGPLSKRDVAAELAALVAFAAAAHHDRVGLLFFADQVGPFVPAEVGLRHALRIVRDILVAEPTTGGTDLAGALAYLGRICRRRAHVFVITDGLATGYDHALKLAARRHDLTLVAIRDRAESTLPALGLAWLADLETQERRLIDTAHPAIRAGYESAARERAERLRLICRQAGARLLDVDTEGDHVNRLIRHFRQQSGR
jgi:uncharacterized protein (DUF58 family)